MASLFHGTRRKSLVKCNRASCSADSAYWLLLKSRAAQFYHKLRIQLQLAVFFPVMDPRDAVRESMHLLGVTALKECQEKAIMSFLGGKDTFVCLPTGYGKSLIYALLPYTFDMIRGKVLL